MTLRKLGIWLAYCVCMTAAAGLAASQVFVIRDKVDAGHANWPEWSIWLSAISMELCILAAGMAMVSAGYKWYLVLIEAALIFVSVAIAWDMTGDWMLSVAPVQYIAVIVAAHTLAKKHRLGGKKVAQRKTAQRAESATQNAMQRKQPIAQRTAQSSRKIARDAAISKIAGGEFDTLLTKSALADAVGVNVSTITRWGVKRVGKRWSVPLSL